MDWDTIAVEHERLASLLAQSEPGALRDIADRLTEHVREERRLLSAALADDRSSPDRPIYDRALQRLMRALERQGGWDIEEVSEAFREHVSSCRPLLARVRQVGAQGNAGDDRPDGASDADESWSAREPARAESPDRSVQAVVDRTQGAAPSPAQE